MASFRPPSSHRNPHLLLVAETYGLFITGIDMAEDAGPGVIGEHSFESTGCFRGSIGNDHHAGMDRVSDTDTPSMVERYPGRSAAGIEHQVE